MSADKVTYYPAIVVFIAMGVSSFASHITYTISLTPEGRSVTAPTVASQSRSWGNTSSFKFENIAADSALYCEVRAIDTDPSQITKLPEASDNKCKDATAGPFSPGSNDALFYYVVKTVPKKSEEEIKGTDEFKALDALQNELAQLRNDPTPLQKLQQAEAATEQEIKDASDAMKAYAGMSTPAAAEGVAKLIEKLVVLQTRLKIEKQAVADKQAYAAKQAEVDAASALVDQLRKDRRIGLRAGIVPMGGDARPVYYRFVQSTNLETPYRLERTGEFPVFTVNNNLYLVIMNHRQSDKPGDFQLSYGTDKGAVIDVAPLRPTIDPPTPLKLLALHTMKPKLAGGEVDFSDAYVDRILPFANKLAGETILTVTVSSYAQVVTTNKEETTSSGTAITLTKETRTVKLLDGEKWPQIHSLFYFNLSTGVVASWLRDPAYSRVLTDVAVPAKGDAAAVPAKYKTAQDRGSARAMPVLAFSGYLRGMDVQVPWHWSDLTPAPTVAFSLTTPADDFLFGGSSEIRRNVQFIYGYHLGKVTQLGPQGVDDPTSSTEPTTIKRFKGNAFLGLTFDVNFIKELFKP